MYASATLPYAPHPSGDSLKASAAVGARPKPSKKHTQARESDADDDKVSTKAMAAAVRGKSSTLLHSLVWNEGGSPLVCKISTLALHSAL